jgi:hypothetical protein
MPSFASRDLVGRHQGDAGEKFIHKNIYKNRSIYDHVSRDGLGFGVVVGSVPVRGASTLVAEDKAR